MNWNHSMCSECWGKYKLNRVPVRVDDVVNKCCYCSQLTDSGIYVREDPRKIACLGVHEEGI